MDAEAPGRGRAAGIVALAVIAAAWIAARPYAGLVHDAQFYMVQALNRLAPEAFGSDLFFAYGSQDSFSVFSPVYAPAVAWLGTGGAHLVFALAGQAVWLAALVVLAVVLFGTGRRAALAALAAAVLIAHYGRGVLQYGEPFVTPRPFAEAVAMLALAAALRGRPAAAWGLGALAAVIHPLMALPALVLLAVLTMSAGRILALGALGAAAALGLAIAGIAPFDRLFARMDGAWLEIVRYRTPHAFVADWSWRGAALAVLPAVSLSLTARYGAGAHRRLARAALALGAVLVAASWIAGDLAGNVLALNLQPWRGLWLVVLLGNLFAVAAIRHLAGDGRAQLFLIAALAANAVEARLTAFPFTSVILIAVAAVAWWAGRRHLRWLTLACTAVAAAVTLVLAAQVAVLVTPWGWDDIARLALRLAVLAGAAGLLAFWRGRAGTGAAAACAAALLAAALAIADRRSAETAYATASAPPEADLAEMLAGRTVYWEAGVALLWFRMRQPSYFSCIQGAGVMFYRETALEYARRAAVLGRLNTADFRDRLQTYCPRRADPQAEGPTSAAQLREACEALPELDLMVLRAAIPEAPHRTWAAPFEVPAPGMPRGAGERAGSTFHIYDCARLRAGAEG